MSPRRPSRPKMPVFEENAPLPTHHRRASVVSDFGGFDAPIKDQQGFAVPSLPQTRLRPISVNGQASKRVVPRADTDRRRTPSVSLGVSLVRKAADGISTEGDETFWGDLSTALSVNEEKDPRAKEKEALGRLERRVKVLETGLRASNKKNEERYDHLEVGLTDIRTDLALRVQTPSPVNRPEASPGAPTIASTTGASGPELIARSSSHTSKSIPFPASPVRHVAPSTASDTTSGIGEFGEYSSLVCGSPPVPALLSRKRREMEMRRLSLLEPATRPVMSRNPDTDGVIEDCAQIADVDTGCSTVHSVGDPSVGMPQLDVSDGPLSITFVKAPCSMMASASPGSINAQVGMEEEKHAREQQCTGLTGLLGTLDVKVSAHEGELSQLRHQVAAFEAALHSIRRELSQYTTAPSGDQWHLASIGEAVATISPVSPSSCPSSWAGGRPIIDAAGGKAWAGQMAVVVMVVMLSIGLAWLVPP